MRKIRGSTNGSAKMSYYKEIDEILKDNKSPTPSSRLELFMHFSKDPSNRSTLAILPADTISSTQLPPWSRGKTPEIVDESSSLVGRVISVKWGNHMRRIGIDGSSEAIKEAIRSAFGLRTKRLLWLEDEDEVVWSLDRDMPTGNYSLHLDEGLTIKICLCDETDKVIDTDERTFYTEDDFREFLTRQGWSCLRDLDAFRSIDNIDDLRAGAKYRGMK